MVVPGHDKFEVPLVNKNKAQVLSVSNKKVNVMDLESFESFEIEITEEQEKELEEGSKIEYWEIDNRRLVKRKL